MKKIQKIITLIAISLLTIYFGYKTIRAYDRRNDGFTIEKIQSTRSFDAHWDIPVSQEQVNSINEILQQPFYYLARGFQCYVFQSQDGKYVIKFVRHQRLRLSEYALMLPDIGWIAHWKQKRQAEVEKRAWHLFNGLKTAFEHVPDETALLFVHINKTKGCHGRVTIVDRIGQHYEIPLDEYEFVVQKKAVWIEPTIDRCMSEGKVNEAKQYIDALFVLLQECAKKGIQDQDGALIRKHNIGFLADRAIYIDTGKLVYKDSIRKKKYFVKDLRRLRPLQKWLRMKYPELAKYFKKAKKRTIREYT